jgi:nicotinic acid mononucleotide adenylyltransferase
VVRILELAQLAVLERAGHNAETNAVIQSFLKNNAARIAWIEIAETSFALGDVSSTLVRNQLKDRPTDQRVDFDVNVLHPSVGDYIYAHSLYRN